MSQTPPPVLPYNTPRPEGISREDLRQIAGLQRGIMICILVYLIAVVGQFALPAPMRLLVGLAMLAVGVVAAVFIFMLAIKLYSTGLGVLLGILTLVPIVALIVLLIVNGKATSLLRSHGIRVGLLGANPSEIQ